MPNDSDSPTYTAQELQERCDWLLDKRDITGSDGLYLKSIYDIVADMMETNTVKDWIEELRFLGGNGYLHKLVKDEEELQQEAEDLNDHS